MFIYTLHRLLWTAEYLDSWNYNQNLNAQTIKRMKFKIQTYINIKEDYLDPWQYIKSRQFKENQRIIGY